MTNLEAIKAAVEWPLSENAYLLALTNRELVSTDTYTATSKAFELAQADCLMKAATMPNISEGGFSRSAADSKAMAKIAEGIYSKHGVSSNSTPVVKFRSVM